VLRLKIPMPIEQADKDFIKNQFPQVEGWCLDDAAYLTCCLLDAQLEAHLSGPSLEIGVYKGKYLSILYHRALRANLRVVGIDTFNWSPRSEVTDKFSTIFGTLQGLYLHSADSSTLDAAALSVLLDGARASFISVDGDHKAPGVEADLRLTNQVLAEGGIIAIDDFLNPRAIGVSEGTYRFFLDPAETGLRPFAYCANKLFVACLEYHQPYRQAILSLVDEAPELTMVQEFRSLRTKGEHWVDMDLLGSKVLIL